MMSRRLGGRDQLAMLVCVVLFSTALGVNAIAFPLRALAAGFGLAAVGYFAAIAAACQIVVRTSLPWVLRRVPDSWLAQAAGGLLGASALVLVTSDTAAAFVASALLLGIARALFWTASQVYVLRGDLGAGQRRLSYLQFLSTAGEFAGPLASGFVAQASLDAALWLWAGCALATLAPATLLRRHQPLARRDRHRSTPVWRHRDVLVGCAAVGTVGGWRGLLSSLIPAVLADAGRTAGQIGVLVSLANAACMLGSLLAGRVRARWIGAVVSAAILAAGLGAGSLGLAAGSVVVAGVVLAASGLGTGLLQTLGPVLAAGAVAEHQRGDVVVMIGLARSITLMSIPAGVAALIGPLAAPLALAVGGGLLAAPVAIRRRSRGEAGAGPAGPTPVP